MIDFVTLVLVLVVDTSVCKQCCCLVFMSFRVHIPICPFIYSVLVYFICVYKSLLYDRFPLMQ
jgi:hypothetical protein